MVRILSVRASDWWSSCDAPPGYAKDDIDALADEALDDGVGALHSRPISALGNAAGEVVSFFHGDGFWIKALLAKNHRHPRWQASE